jgi:hypothetical protein
LLLKISVQSVQSADSHKIFEPLGAIFAERGCKDTTKLPYTQILADLFFC